MTLQQKAAWLTYDFTITIFIAMGSDSFQNFLQFQGSFTHRRNHYITHIFSELEYEGVRVCVRVFMSV